MKASLALSMGDDDEAAAHVDEQTADAAADSILPIGIPPAHRVSRGSEILFPEKIDRGREAEFRGFVGRELHALTLKVSCAGTIDPTVLARRIVLSRSEDV